MVQDEQFEEETQDRRSSDNNNQQRRKDYTQMRAEESRPLRDKALLKGIQLTEYVGLLIITIATIFAAGAEVAHMIDQRAVTLGDLLLMFLYLEVLAMIAIYLKSGKLPIRFPIYIAIVALARLLVLDMKELTEWEMISVAATITLLTFSVLILRYGHIKLPYILNRRKDD